MYADHRGDVLYVLSNCHFFINCCLKVLLLTLYSND